jgi:hypothetical protein
MGCSRLATKSAIIPHFFINSDSLIGLSFSFCQLSTHRLNGTKALVRSCLRPPQPDCLARFVWADGVNLGSGRWHLRAEGGGVDTHTRRFEQSEQDQLNELFRLYEVGRRRFFGEIAETGGL